MCGCANSVMPYIESRYPKCVIEEIESNRDSITVKVSCPYKKPFEETFRSK